MFTKATFYFTQSLSYLFL